MFTVQRKWTEWFVSIQLYSGNLTEQQETLQWPNSTCIQKIIDNHLSSLGKELPETKEAV